MLSINLNFASNSSVSVLPLDDVWIGAIMNATGEPKTAFRNSPEIRIGLLEDKFLKERAGPCSLAGFLGFLMLV